MIDIDLRDFTDFLTKLEGVCDSLPHIAERVKDEALGHAIIGAHRNVYDTPAGAYERTQDYLRGFHTSSRATKNTASVSVWNDVDYAEAIEVGSGPHEMTMPQLQAQATPNPYAPPYFGRSGLKYSLAGPALVPAQVFALVRLQDLFGEKLVRIIG